MPIGLTRFDYTLECEHTAFANVPTSEYDDGSSGAYRLGDYILCPQDSYIKKKIVAETITRDDVIVSDSKGATPIPSDPAVVE